eukprot:5824567-Ditylum_brightwellii.AAC.1
MFSLPSLAGEKGNKKVCRALNFDEEHIKGEDDSGEHNEEDDDSSLEEDDIGIDTEEICFIEDQRSHKLECHVGEKEDSTLYEESVESGRKMNTDVCSINEDEFSNDVNFNYEATTELNRKGDGHYVDICWHNANHNATGIPAASASTTTTAYISVQESPNISGLNTTKMISDVTLHMKENRDGKRQKNLSSMLKKSSDYCHATSEPFCTKQQQMEREGKKFVIWFDDVLEQIYGSWKVQKVGGYKPFALMKKSLEDAPDKLTCG